MGLAGLLAGQRAGDRAYFVGFAYAASHSGPAGMLERLTLTAGPLWIAALAVQFLPRADA